MSSVTRREVIIAGAALLGVTALAAISQGRTAAGDKTVSQVKPLPDDLAKFRDSYKEMFGEVPPLPAAKFEFSGEIDPEAVRLAEKFRAHAFYNKVFDPKTTQLLLFGMLLAVGSDAAQHHAHAARRAGASWQELQQVVELASAMSALGPFNQGSAMLNKLRSQDKK